MFSFQGQVLVFIIISHIVFVELMPSLGLCNKADDSTKGMYELYDVPTYAHQDGGNIILRQQGGRISRRPRPTIK